MIIDLLLNSRGRLALPFRRPRFRSMSGMSLPPQMPFHPEVNSQNDGDDGYGANHQNRKQNLHHHGNSGYQNGGKAHAFFTPPKCAFTRTKFFPQRGALEPRPPNWFVAMVLSTVEFFILRHSHIEHALRILQRTSDSPSSFRRMIGPRRTSP